MRLYSGGGNYERRHISEETSDGYILVVLLGVVWTGHWQIRTPFTCHAASAIKAIQTYVDKALDVLRNPTENKEQNLMNYHKIP